MNRDKFHAELRFHAQHKETKRFTAVDLDRLMKRFADEVKAECERRTKNREYTVVIPSLTTEWCRSWSEFDQYEHS